MWGLVWYNYPSLGDVTFLCKKEERTFWGRTNDPKDAMQWASEREVVDYIGDRSFIQCRPHSLDNVVITVEIT